MGSGPPTGSASGRLEAEQVRSMFDGIAGVYDLLNTAMTAGLHHRWRARAADLARVGPGDRVLDVATGTGDLALELAGRVGPGGEVIGSDFAEGMLERAREKAATRAEGGDGVRPRFEWGDALELQYAKRLVRRGDGRLRRAQLRRPRARSGRDAPRGAPGRARGRARDHDAGEASAVDLLRLVVRSPGAAARDAPRRPRRASWRGCAPAHMRPTATVTGQARSRRRTRTCRTRSSASRRRRALAAELDRAGLQEISYVLLAGGIVAIHAGTVPPGAIAGGGDR